MAKVAIVGIGAIGGTIAALLQSASKDEITLCTRRPLESRQVHTPQGTITLHAQNLISPDQAEPVDWVLVATKAYDCDSTAPWLKNLCTNSTTVAILQNGVEHRERFARYLPPDQILPVVIDCPAERQPDGSIRQRDTAHMHIANTPQGQQFAQLFEETAANVQLTGDFLTALWRKLCINSAGAVPALAMQPAGILHNPALGQIALEITAECAAVGRAEGAHLDQNIAQFVLDYYRAQPPDSINSLLADRLAGRRMEIDARNGVIVRLGEKHGIPTSLNRMAVALLQADHLNAARQA